MNLKFKRVTPLDPKVHVFSDENCMKKGLAEYLPPANEVCPQGDVHGGGVHGGGCEWQGACVAGGLHVGDVHGGGMRGKGEGACVAAETTIAVTQFYWNAFLCTLFSRRGF